MSHEKAVRSAVKAAEARLNAADQPLVEFALAMAKQVDAAGPDGPGSRLSATYLTLLRTLSARLAPLVSASNPSKLAELRALRDRQQPQLKNGKGRLPYASLNQQQQETK